MDSPGDEVRQAERELIAAQRAAASGTRKRKAGGDSTDDRREHTKRPLRRERSRPRARRNVSTIDLRRNLKCPNGRRSLYMADIRRLWAREMAARGAQDQHQRIGRSRWPSTSKPLEKGAHHQTRRVAENIGNNLSGMLSWTKMERMWDIRLLS